MKYRVNIKAVKPCGCDAEGEVIASFENGNIVHFYYQGSDSDAIQAFKVGANVEVELLGENCTIELTDQKADSLNFPNRNCYFISTGVLKSKELYDGELYYLLNSSFDLLIDNTFESTGFSLGSVVKVTGELWVDNWWP